MLKRPDVIKVILDFPEDLHEASSKLYQFSFDYDGEPLILKKEHVLNALTCIVNGTRTADEIERWANIIECRDDIDFEEVDEDVLGQVLHNIANPYLKGALTPELCSEYRNLLLG